MAFESEVILSVFIPQPILPLNSLLLAHQVRKPIYMTTQTESHIDFHGALLTE